MPCGNVGATASERAICRVSSLPPDDQPDAVDIGPVRGIPIIEPDDPRFKDERLAWSEARSKAQAMHATDDLLQGLRDGNWMVRFEVVDRLIARAPEDERTLPALIEAANDSTAAVREVVVMGLRNFADQRATAAIRRAMSDDDPDVRWAAEFAAQQAGE